jgi:hypothetical protein
MFIAYFMTFVLSCETNGSITVLGIMYRFLSIDIVFLCVLPRAPAVSTKSGSTFQPLTLMLSSRPSYFTVLSFILCSFYAHLTYNALPFSGSDHASCGWLLLCITCCFFYCYSFLN